MIERSYLLREQGRSDTLKRELDKWKTYGQIGLIAAGLFLLTKFSGAELQISHDKNDLAIHSWSWWGLSKKDTPIVWREDRWMAQDKNGEWYVAVAEPEYDPPDPGP
ncbi:MAG TPA: hypothetical protein VGW39_00070 [Chthoniobacterales bacterium]|nr:hypothetical protein [Chthoniobacterales bacterium]